MTGRFTIFFAVATVALFAMAGPSPGHQLDGGSKRQMTGLLAGLAEPNVRAGSTAWGAAASAVPQASPRPDCGPGSRPETGIQGRVPAGSTAGFTCNTELVGRHGLAGGYKVLRYTDSAGHECAYYDNTLLFPNNARSLSSEPTGVTVLDMSNPAKPVRTATLSTPAMQSPPSRSCSTRSGASSPLCSATRPFTRAWWISTTSARTAASRPCSRACR